MNVLNLHRITAFVIAENKSSLGVAASCGYVKEGVMKKYYINNGRYHDLVVMGRLAGS